MVKVNSFSYRTFPLLIHLLLIFFHPIHGMAEGWEEIDITGIGTGYAGGETGFVKIGEDYFLRINPCVELPIRRWLFGFQLPLHILVYDNDPQGESSIRREDWDEPSDYAKVIRHIRYGWKWDPIFFDYGTLYGSSLGHGTIFYNYYNNIFTDSFHGGLNIGLDTKYGGGEFILGNIFSPYLYGFRLFARPFYIFSKGGEKEGMEGWRSKFATGLSFAGDVSAPHLTEGQLGYEGLYISGIDVEYRIQVMKSLRITPYIDYMQILRYGGGIHLGVQKEFISSFLNSVSTMKLEYRYMAKNYLPTYFDTIYEMERWGYQYNEDEMDYLTKLDILEGSEKEYGEHGYMGSISINFGGYLSILGALEGREGEDDSEIYLGLSVPDILNLGVDIFYYKNRFDIFMEAFDPDGAIIVAGMWYKIMNSIYLYLRFSRLFEEVEENRYQSIDTISAGIGARIYF